VSSSSSFSASARRILLQTETRLDELGHARDNDTGSDSTMLDLADASAVADATTGTVVAKRPLSFILSFAIPVHTAVVRASSVATMTETFERGGAGGRDNDADAVATGTETKVGDPTARDQDVELGSYAPIGTRRRA
jgi:hypothetical protein